MPITGDYERTTEQVYRDFAAQTRLRMPHRTILSLVRRSRPPQTTGEQRAAWPSWVPHFDGLDTHFRPISAVQYGRWKSPLDFAAGIDDPAFSRLEIIGKELRLYARCCAKVSTHWRLPPRPSGRRMRDAYLSEIIWVTSILEECVKIGRHCAGGDSTVTAMFRILSDDASDLQGTYSEGRHLRLNHLLGLTVTEPELMYPDDTEVVAAVRSCKEQLLKLEAQSGIPTEEDIKRLGVTFRLFGHYEQMADEDPDLAIQALSALQRLWPEYHLVTHHGHVDKNELNELEVDLLQRTDIRVSSSYTMFATDNEYLGRIQGGLEDGDELWLICQAFVPFILRPLPDGKFSLVGEAFVHGAMFGEFIKNGFAGEPEWITII